ncbi:S-layer homology domain-containing protein [Paenibacillus sp. PAMC21692]|uniref:S-layer homology domain-containing protein n=1 Tax=Paenibacillus sp. PAMC21692 TaxID=2762320 RepID=UPI00164E1F93|nr:S-layer homology domain-containing protein [Paenibacillus sp. PAMC21692]QNK56517.1 S-layer homology domain-containing protein [Paenibacillus sp. PAMC21692]
MNNFLDRCTAIVIICAMLVGAVLAPAGTASANASDNLLSMTESAKPTYWSIGTSGSPPPVVAYRLDDQVKYGGSHSLHVQYSSPRTSNQFLNINQAVDVEPNTEYVLNMRIKGENLQSTNGVNAVTFGFDWASRDGAGSGTFDWKPVSKSIKTASNQNKLTVRILIENYADAVWIDEVTLRKKEDVNAPNLIRNGGFEVLKVDGVSASMPSGTVPEGTEVTLSTATAGADIVYTMDNSDPLDSATRLLYSGPIAIHENTTIRAIASMPGMIDSEEAVFQYVIGVHLEQWSDFAAGFGGRTHMPIFYAEDMALSGEPDHWESWGAFTGISLPHPSRPEQTQIAGYGGAEDLSAEAKFAYNEQYFYMAVKVRDNVHHPVANADMWSGDSVQIGFGDNGVYGPEYGFNLAAGNQPQIWRWNNGGATMDKSSVNYDVSRTDDSTYYEAAIPWAAIYGEAGFRESFHFSMVINDNDGSGRRGWIEWTSGIGRVKDGNQLAQLDAVPAGDKWSLWMETLKEAESGQSIPYKIFVPNYGTTSVTVRLQSPEIGLDKEASVPPGKIWIESGQVQFNTQGQYQLDVVATSPGDEKIRERGQRITVLPSAAELQLRFNQLDAALSEVESLLTEAESHSISTDYERVKYTTAKDFIAYGRTDISRGQLERARYVADTLQSLLEEAETALTDYLSGSKTPLAAPRYTTPDEVGALSIEGYGYTGNTRVRSSGAAEERPIFFNGYGHFGQVRADLHKFQDYGANIIQIETGPNKVFVQKEGYVNDYGTGGSARGSIALDADIKHSGNYSLKIVNQSPKQPNVYKSVSQSVAVEPNTTYAIKLWVKGDGVQQAWFPGGPNWNFRKALPIGTYDWQEVSYTYTTGASETVFTLIILSENAQTIWIDDLSMVKTDAAENLLLNPGFEMLPNFDGVDPDADYFLTGRNLEANVLNVLAMAEEQDIAVNLLLSPHYFPEFLLNNHPEVRSNSNGFIKFIYSHPFAEEIIEQYLRYVIPQVKDFKSLHSVTISNEPVFQTDRDAYYAPIWQDYLRELYDNDIGLLNAAYSSSYASFGEVQMPQNIEGKPIVYDWIVLNNKLFAEWHQWMADIIHEIAPDLPVQVKVMASLQNSLDWGIDYEMFSELSDINGNDAYNLISSGAEGFIRELGFYDMQRSFNPAPIFNSEHHFIKDGDNDYTAIQAQRVRAVLWQGAVHGKTASTNWVWERTYDPTSDFAGSLLHRPDVVADIGRTNHDLNRLAHEVTTLQNAPAEAAILYAWPSGLYTQEYYYALYGAYEALVYSGQHVRFVSEKQIAAGGLDPYRLLIVPNATHVQASTLDEISEFSSNGGRVIVIGENALSRNEHDQLLSTGVRTGVFDRADAALAASSSAQAIRSALLPVLDDLELTGIMLNDASAASDEPVYGVHWQSAEYNDRTLVNIVNYSEGPVTVTLDAPYEIDSIKELISGESLGGTAIVLEPLTPYLLEVTAEEEQSGGGNGNGHGNGNGSGEQGNSNDDEDNGAEEAEGTEQSGNGTEEAENFPEWQDIAGHWAADAIRLAAKHNIVNGYEDGTFRPEHKVTRQQFAVMLARALELPESGAAVPFADDGQLPEWARSGVYSAVEAGLLKGYEDGTYRGAREISRAEMAVMLVRAAKYAGKLADPANDVTHHNFDDAQQIPDWAMDSVQVAVANGLLQGRGAKRFAPLEPLTRAEGCVLLIRLLDLE